jgi:hypothetical protein
MSSGASRPPNQRLVVGRVYDSTVQGAGGDSCANPNRRGLWGAHVTAAADDSSDRAVIVGRDGDGEDVAELATAQTDGGTDQGYMARDDIAWRDDVVEEESLAGRDEGAKITAQAGSVFGELYSARSDTVRNDARPKDARSKDAIPDDPVPEQARQDDAIAKKPLLKQKAGMPDDTASSGTSAGEGNSVEAVHFLEAQKSATERLTAILESFALVPSTRGTFERSAFINTLVERGVLSPFTREALPRSWLNDLRDSFPQYSTELNADLTPSEFVYGRDRVPDEFIAITPLRIYQISEYFDRIRCLGGFDIASLEALIWHSKGTEWESGLQIDSGGNDLPEEEDVCEKGATEAASVASIGVLGGDGAVAEHTQGREVEHGDGRDETDTEAGGDEEEEDDEAGYPAWVVSLVLSYVLGYTGCDSNHSASIVL